WRFVGAPTLTAYLDRLTRQLEPPSGRQPSGVRVEVFDQPRVWTLALPSGTVLLSRGALESVEDEAELVFVLAHELSHSAEPGAARRLARLGLREVAAGESDGSPGVWARAAVDLIRVGHGRELEFAADAAGFAAAARLGYDLGAVRRYLDRLGTRQETGDAAVAELVLAHPPVASRLRRLDAFVANRPPERRRVTRTNREVFRRVAGVQVLATRLAPVEGLGERRTARQSVPERANERGVRPWLVLAALLVALAAIVGWYWW
ncbi:MAG TPA: M48 family metalloprotease, partial [Candidatus Polarisedimenticolaceae bacterium]|nr:M48 family metalloprotease [Candidatus Polarisedimenticolaceae bacterium]